MIAGLLASLAAVSADLHWAQAAALAVPMALVYAFMCLAALYLCRAFPLQETGFLRLLGVYALASSLSSSLWILIGRAWVSLLVQLDVFAGLEVRFDNQIPLFLGVGVLLFLLAVVVHYLLIAFENSLAVERKALELSALVREAELKALKSQLQPHFLFNSLNSISALTALDAAAARNMCLRLADFLRQILRMGGQHEIPLGEELALVENFLTVEQVRFGSRLQFVKRVDTEALGCLVPSLLLQPLVENAVNHGIAQVVEGGTITLEARCDGTRLAISLVNPYDPAYASARGRGVGLGNVRERLATLYGNEARMDVQRGPSSFRVDMSIPVNQSA
jgi:sensor histidine kinase YesM